ncbi:adenosine deaminase [Leptospira wolffii]|uniref:Adenosine deaminase n=1 Tax=Leptospira wolffii TaxID=409998 RepID=A0A2M9Z8X5_9LEPT|nr:adenosine deaminase [Leptospira wolffii]EPG66337.1 adenosine deaminase [Leptospira wolffii serovar Khorat str. Khorat-H2]PJZ64881.1 adenosine deaminase [Leptospira wolffii]
MGLTFAEILDRIRILDRDVSELNRLKSRLPADRPYSSSLQISFDKQINNLLNERVRLLDLEIENPPRWILGDTESFEAGRSTASALLEPTDLSSKKLQDQDVINFIRELPKTEIHLHLEACVNKETMKKLMAKNSIQLSDEEFEAKFNFKDLNGFIQVFFFIQSLVKEPADLYHFVGSLAEYMRTNNILYTEVFFAPSKFIQNGLDFEEMVQQLVDGIREEKTKDGIEIRLLVDVSRSFGPENAMNNLNRVLKLKHKEVIGIGLGGAELMGPARDYAEVFRKAREAGLRVVAHSGEDDGPWAIWEAVELCKAERIGHGTSAIQDPELVNYLREHKIPIEICVTSNVFTGKYVRKEQNHPVRYYYDQGIPLCINTDDPEIFNVNLTYEYFKLWRFLDFSLEEIVDLVRQGVFATFHPQKESLWKEMDIKIKKVKEKYGLLESSLK